MAATSYCLPTEHLLAGAYLSVPLVAAEDRGGAGSGGRDPRDARVVHEVVVKDPLRPRRRPAEVPGMVMLSRSM